jgi:hypothetical protein
MQDAALPECPQFGVGGDRLYVMNCLLDWGSQSLLVPNFPTLQWPTKKKQNLIAIPYINRFIS